MNAIWTNIFSKSNLKVRDYLKKVPVFSDLSNTELKKLEKHMIRRKFVSKEYIFHQLEPGAGMYIIINGDVKIQIDCDCQLPKELACLAEGDFFGEMALLDESPRSASAVAASDNVELLSFFRGDLLKVMQEQPEIACKILWNIGGVISARLRKNNELMTLMESKNDK